MAGTTEASPSPEGIGDREPDLYRFAGDRDDKIRDDFTPVAG